MCPICIASTAAWIAAAASTGGISALVISKLRNKHHPTPPHQPGE